MTASETEVLSAARAYLRQFTEAGDFTAALDRVAGTPELRPLATPPDVVTAHDWVSLSSARSRRLVETMVRHRDRLLWFQPYEGDPRAGDGFAERATANPSVGPWAPLKADHVGMGFFPVGPNVIYGEHAHQPEEIYVPIAGRARFHCDSYGTIETGPDRVLLQPSWDWHRMETDEYPVLILWVWIGGGLNANPVFRDVRGNSVEVDL